MQCKNSINNDNSRLPAWYVGKLPDEKLIINDLGPNHAKQWRKERVVEAGLGEEFDFMQAESEDQTDTVAETTDIVML